MQFFRKDTVLSLIKTLQEAGLKVTSIFSEAVASKKLQLEKNCATSILLWWTRAPERRTSPYLRKAKFVISLPYRWQANISLNI